MPSLQIDEHNDFFMAILLRNIRVFENNFTIEIGQITKEAACNQGDNYMSTVSRFLLLGTCTCPVTTLEKPYKRSIIVKVPLNTDESKNVFKYEKIAYEEVVPKLESVCKFRLPFAKLISSHPEFICLEDLKETGFELAKRREGFNMLESQGVLKALAKFHASSIILKHRDLKAFNRFKGILCDQLYADKSHDRVSSQFKITLKLINYRLTTSPLPIIKNNQRKLNELLTKLSQINAVHTFEQNVMDLKETKDDAQVICHNDFWANNIMMRYNNETPRVYQDSMIIDLQTFCVSSWARDLIYFFATNLQMVEREPLCKYYIEQLVEILKNDNLPEKVIEIFTYDLLLDEFSRLRNLHLLTALWLLTPISLMFEPIERHNQARPPSNDEEIEKLSSLLEDSYDEKVWVLLNQLNNEKYLETDMPASN